MGVASFFRWVVARYPKALQPAVEEEPITDQTEQECGNYLEDNQFLHIDCTLPNPNGEEFANLYLDLNGVVHMCTHPEDRPPPATEDDMFQEIFRYIDRIVALVRPRRLIYLAIDGVAPRAKINQQRSRRFRAAREAREKEEEEEKLRALWREQGLRVPPKPKRPFDSNVITPGTPFMERLAAALGTYVRERLRSCAAWRSLVVILSDASVPGEGEHKIAEFIRTQRAQPGYDKQTSHVLYGLDADLIMLALATHEPHFFILRERVYFDYRADKAMHAVKNMNEQHHGQHEVTNKGTGTMSVKAPDRLSSASSRPFDFFRIDRLREYLDAEFRDALVNGSSKIPGDLLDIERVIDDFVFLCFFVGNDFLPHLPSLEIREGAIDFLLEVYKSSFARVGHLTDGHGGIHFDRVREILREVARVEDYVFQERARMARSFANQTTTLPMKASETQHASIQTANEDVKKQGNLTLTAPNEERRQTKGTESKEAGKHVISSPLTLPGTAERASKLLTTEQDSGLGLVPLPRKHVKENRAITMRNWKRPENERSNAAVVDTSPSDAAASAIGSMTSHEMEQDVPDGVDASPTAVSVQAAAVEASEWQSEVTASGSASKMQGESGDDLRRKRRRVLDDDAGSDSGQMPTTDVTEPGAKSVANDLVGQSPFLADSATSLEAKCASGLDSRRDQSRGLVGNLRQVHGPAEPQGIARLESHESVQDVERCRS
ncbi:5'-3' exoribonuclease 2 [Cyanidiococcus yangmingshanensis]|uniref:5'-3' exoribonuclease 2 n=1 Tax=Cyanidiococcus yangmingshanensis TaxID=2690220 RepID=A0A7J7IJJ2_9RHOD|nr:5'-3' exoribonuclease 2 [Cyanidiococcus yangmingshanensis]